MRFTSSFSVGTSNTVASRFFPLESTRSAYTNAALWAPAVTIGPENKHSLIHSFKAALEKHVFILFSKVLESVCAHLSDSSDRKKHGQGILILCEKKYALQRSIVRKFWLSMVIVSYFFDKKLKTRDDSKGIFGNSWFCSKWFVLCIRKYGRRLSFTSVEEWGSVTFASPVSGAAGYAGETAEWPVSFGLCSLLRQPVFYLASKVLNRGAGTLPCPPWCSEALVEQEGRFLTP